MDSRRANMLEFLTPYSSEMYHLSDYRESNRAPKGPQKLLKYRHSSLHNVIERYFGVLKDRFAILKYISNYQSRY